MSQGDVEARVVADTSGLQAGMVQAVVVTADSMKKIAEFIRLGDDAQKKLSKTVKDAANSDSYSKIAEGAKKVESAHAGVNRELIVLAHEMSQGNYSRFGGSLLVLGERMDILSKLTTPAGVAVGALAAIVGGSVVAMAMGAIEADKFAKSLQLTGNYAAVTASQIKLMADVQAHQTGQSVSGARGSLEAVAGSGLFGPAELAAASRAMGDYQKVTGETAAEALKNFTRIQDGVAKWAEEENKTVHFLTLAEYEHIKALEDSGDRQGAVVTTLTAYAQAIESRAVPSLGYLARAWREVTESADQFKQAMMDIGRPDTLADKIADLQRQILWDKTGNAGGSYADRMRDMAAKQAELAKLMAQAQSESQAALKKSQDAQAAQAAIAGKAYEESILRQAHALSERTKELQRWDAQRKADEKAGAPMSDVDYKAGVAEINKRYAKQPSEAQANEYQSLTATIKAFNDATNVEIDGQRRLTEGQRFLIQVQEEVAKSAKHMSDAQKEAKVADAARAASLRDLADAGLASQKSMMEDADKTIKQSTAAMQAQQKALEAFQRSGQKQVSDIDFNTSLLGKSPDEAARMQAQRAIASAANKALESASGQRLNEILAMEAKQRDEVTAAMDRNLAGQKALTENFDAGWSTALQDFVKNAQDNAAAGKKIFDDMATNMTDAITQAATTGKLSIKSMVDSIIKDLIRVEAQKGVAAIFSALSGGGGGGGGGGPTGSIFDLFSSSFGGSAYAGGIDNVPYNGMPAVLHEGERVMTRIENQRSRDGSGQAVHIHMGPMNFGAGVDASGVAQAVHTGMAQVKNEIYRQLSTRARSA